MSWLKPPPLIHKPPPPIIKTDWKGLPLRLVRQVVLVSVSFWLIVLFIPALVIFILIWPVLRGTVWGAICAFGVLFTVYVSLKLGLLASHFMIDEGYLQRELMKRAKPKI